MVIMAILRMNDHKRMGIKSHIEQTEQEVADPNNFGFYNEKE
jgi:hypothetical protein